MPNENENVVPEEKTSGEGTAVIEKPETGASGEPQIDYKAEYEKYQKDVLPRHNELESFYNRFENVITKQPWVEQAIRDAMAGKQWTPAQQAAVEKSLKAEGKEVPKAPQVNLKEMPEYQEMKQTLDEFKKDKEQQAIIGQLTSEMNLISEKFDWMKDKAAQDKFLEDVDKEIRKETIQLANQGMDMSKANQLAVNKWNNNLLTSFVLLRDKEITDHFSQASGRRSILPPGVQTAADRVGKPGALPGMHERYEQAIRNEPDTAKRNALRVEWANSGGPSVDDQLTSKIF